MFALLGTRSRRHPAVVHCPARVCACASSSEVTPPRMFLQRTIVTIRKSLRNGSSWAIKLLFWEFLDLAFPFRKLHSRRILPEQVPLPPPLFFYLVAQVMNAVESLNLAPHFVFGRSCQAPFCDNEHPFSLSHLALFIDSEKKTFMGGGKEKQPPKCHPRQRKVEAGCATLKLGG